MTNTIKRIIEAKKVMREFRATQVCCACGKSGKLHYHTLDKTKKTIALGQIMNGELLENILQELSNTSVLCPTCVSIVSRNAVNSFLVTDKITPISTRKFLTYCEQASAITLHKM